jgi:hypothetical protein
MSRTRKPSTLGDKEIYEDIKKLVIERVKASSDDLRISLGSNEYTKEEILKSIKEENEIGREFIEIQMEYLRDMAEGAIYQQGNE